MKNSVDQIDTFVDMTPDPGAWIPRTRGSRRSAPSRMTAKSSQGRSTVTTVTVPVSAEVRKRQAKKAREARKRVEYLEALTAAGVELSPSQRRYF